MNDTSNCYRYFYKAVRLARQLHNKPAECSVRQELGAYYTEFGNYTKGFKNIQKALEYPDTTYMWPVYATKGMYYFYTGRQDSASFYYRKLTGAPDNTRRRTAWQSLGEIALKQGDYRKAAQYYQRYAAEADSALYNDNAEATRRVAAQYNYQLRERENVRLKAEAQRQKNRLIIIVSALSVFIAIMATVYEFYKRKESQKLSRFEKIQAASDAHEKAVEELKQSEIYNRFRFSDKPMKEDDWKCLMETARKAYPFFLKRLREFYPLSQLESRVSFLLKLEFSPSQIAILTARSKQAVTSIRKRLCGKALPGGQPSAGQWDRFIRKF